MSLPVIIFTGLYLIFIVIANQLGLYSLSIPKNIVNKEVVITGTISDVPETDAEKTVFILRISSPTGGEDKGEGVKDLPHNTKILVRCLFPVTNLEQGSIVKIKGKSTLPKPAKNPGEFDYRKYLERKRISAILWVYQEENIEKIGQGKIVFITVWSNYLREKILKIIKDNLPEEESAVLSGILIGDKSGLTDEIQKIFIDAGVMHVLVVSGANVGFAIAIFYWIFRYLFRLRKKVAWILTIPVIIIYALITGANPPVVRASIMAIVFILTYLLQRDVSIYQSLALSFLVIILFEPLTLFDIGFQLSFSATFGIIFLMKKFLGMTQKLSRVLIIILSVFFVSVSAQLFVNPIMAYYFHRLSLVAIISNLIIVPLIAIISWSGSILFFAAGIGGLVLKIVSQTNYLLVHWLIQIVNFFAHWKYATIFVPQPNVIFLVWYYFSLILIWQIKSSRKKIFIAGQIICLIWFSTDFWINHHKLRITFLSVGQGDSVFVELPGHRTMLIDGGGNLQSNYDIGERIVAPFLLTRGYMQINKLILTHWNYNHYQGLVKIVKDFKVDEFFIGTRVDDNNELMQLVKDKEIKQSFVVAGQKWATGKTKIEFFNPQLESTTNYDDNSIVTKISFGKLSVLLCGDIGPETQNKLASSELDSVCLLIPNHGQKKLDDKFLDSVSPEIAIISGTRFSKELLTQLESKNIKVFTTKKYGAITIESTGNKYKVTTFTKYKL